MILVQHTQNVQKHAKNAKQIIPLGQRENLKCNPTNTVAVLFSKKRKPKQKFLKLGGKFIKNVTQVKYLGVTLDRRLSWRDDINGK